MTTRLRLRGGLRVARRDTDHLQIGIDPPYRAVLPDRPEVRRLLDRLAVGDCLPPRSPAGLRALAALEAAGLVEDRSAVEAAAAARRRLAVEVDAPESVADDVRRALRRADLPDRAAGGPVRRVVVVVGEGEIARDVVDGLVRDDVPHLPVAVGPTIRVGPFVAPGLTSCLRCVDAHLADRDPRRAVVLEQLSGPGRPLGRPVDPATEQLAWAWVARDLVSYAEGRRPATWSTSVTVDPGLELPRSTWQRHPRCGCSWDAVAADRVG